MKQVIAIILMVLALVGCTSAPLQQSAYYGESKAVAMELKEKMKYDSNEYGYGFSDTLAIGVIHGCVDVMEANSNKDFNVVAPYLNGRSESKLPYDKAYMYGHNYAMSKKGYTEF